MFFNFFGPFGLNYPDIIFTLSFFTIAFRYHLPLPPLLKYLTMNFSTTAGNFFIDFV
jgi:hypothetical protein